KRLAGLIADLDDERFTVRERASSELALFGEAAAPALRKKLADKPSLEARQRVEQLLARLNNPLGAWSPDELRGVRALEVLERVGTSEASQILESLSKGASGDRLAQEAKASLDRLAR